MERQENNKNFKVTLAIFGGGVLLVCYIIASITWLSNSMSKVSDKWLEEADMLVKQSAIAKVGPHHYSTDIKQSTDELGRIVYEVKTDIGLFKTIYNQSLHFSPEAAVYIHFPLTQEKEKYKHLTLERMAAFCVVEGGGTNCYRAISTSIVPK
ncbi:hypothetical protein ACP3V5_17560 [Vibrio maritimus]